MALGESLGKELHEKRALSALRDPEAGAIVRKAAFRQPGGAPRPVKGLPPSPQWSVQVTIRHDRRFSTAYRLLSPLWLAHDEDGARSGAHDVCRDASEGHSLQTGSPVGTDHDERRFGFLSQARKPFARRGIDDEAFTLGALLFEQVFQGLLCGTVARLDRLRALFLELR